MERELIGVPAEATLLGFELWSGEGPVHMLGVSADEWPPSLPHLVLDWNAPDRPRKIIVLTALVSIGWSQGPVWLVRWSWQQPQNSPDYKLINGNAPPTTAQWDRVSTALRRLHPIAKDARRPRDSTLWAESEFRQMAASERKCFIKRNGRPPQDTELAPLVGVSESTLKRYKRKGWLTGST